METDFERLMDEADRQPFSGWDFSYLTGRLISEDTSWSYRDLVGARLSGVPAVLDIGTGGGEILASLQPLPPRTVATEAYPPNVEVARARLTPLGVEVVAAGEAPGNIFIQRGEGPGSLPFADSSFPLIINRHTSYYPAEMRRLLAPGGRFVTQQVGGQQYYELNDLLGVPDRIGARRWNLTFAVRQLEADGLRILDAREEFPESVFRDIGAVAYYLKAVPWQIPDFTIEGYRNRLRTVHERIAREGGLRVHGHSFFIEAVRPQ
jgi:SAM-dependent methyltransferase